MLNLGLIGHPLGHSVSPAIFEAAFASVGLSGRYDLLEVPSEQLADRLATWVEAGYLGFNVTVPYKERALELADDASAAARAIGAANVLVVRDGKLVADNVDAPAFKSDLIANGIDVAGRHAIVLGSGGGAAAVSWELLRLGARVSLVNRTLDRARKLKQRLERDQPQAELSIATCDELLEQRDCALLVNCTSVGMWPDADACAWPERSFPPGLEAVYDTVYNPETTALLRRARAEGIRALGGLGMLARQAALSFRLFTGSAAELPPLEQGARQALARRS